MLRPEQIFELLRIIDRNHNIYFITQFGEDFLTKEEKDKLVEEGVDFTKLYQPENDLIFNSFHFGILAQSLLQQAENIEYSDLKQYISRGEYLPLTTREKIVLESIRSQSLSDIKGLKGRIFQDINQILINNTRPIQEEFLREEILNRVLSKKSVEEIAREIGKKTGDWNRDFDRIVQFVSHTAYEEGKVSHILKYSGEEDPEVYKTVYEGSCRHCIRLYLTEGLGSQPRLFKLSVLRSNGTNIGRKVDDWKPTIGPTHPYCFTNRRTPIYTSKGYKYIKDIQVGDLVLTHKKRFRKVTELIFSERVVDYTYNIVCKTKEKGREIFLRDITGEHPVMVNGNWVKVSNIKVGQKLHMLYDMCSYDNCKKSYPIYYSDEIDRARVDHCSVSCKSFDKSNSRTISERELLTNNARKSLKKKYPNSEQLHTSEVRHKISSKLGSSRYISYIELKLRFILDSLGIEYKTDFLIERTIKDIWGRRRFFHPDIYIPSLNIVLEADGINWHDIEKDKLRDIEIKKSINADVFRFTEDDIRNNILKVKEEIERILKNHRGEYSFEHLEVIRIEKKKKIKKVKLYNFSVEEDESYIANGFIVHNCRCNLNHYIKGQIWNREKKLFEFDTTKEYQPTVNRKKVKIKVGNKEFIG